MLRMKEASGNTLKKKRCSNTVPNEREALIKREINSLLLQEIKTNVNYIKGQLFKKTQKDLVKYATVIGMHMVPVCLCGIPSRHSATTPILEELMVSVICTAWTVLWHHRITAINPPLLTWSYAVLEKWPSII